MVVILSGETASRSEAVLQSKDPYELGGCRELLVLKIELNSKIFLAR